MDDGDDIDMRKTASSPPFSPKRMKGSVAPHPEYSLGGTASGDATHEPKSVHEFVRSKKIKRRRHSRWHILRRRMTRKGVVAVNKEHPNYIYLSCFREGIRNLFYKNSDIQSKEILNPEDFERVITANLNFEGQEFEFSSYADSVFATLRHAIGVGESTYIGAVAPSNLPYLEFISNSKSGQDFFLSNDMQFMFKSNRKRDVKFFLSMLRDYLQHFISFPHSLLVKYVGCYSIQFKGGHRKYFLAMQSIFFPADRIEDRFDIKGCTAGRYQKPNKPGSNIITVLKDQNFAGEELDFGDQSDWFLSQIKADSQFLQELNCMDYSLLLGRQKRHISETQPDSVATLINRIGHSIYPVVTPLRLSAESLADTIETERSESHAPSLRSDTNPSISDNNKRSNPYGNHHHSNNNNNNHNDTASNNGSAVYFSPTMPTPRSESSATREIPGTCSSADISRLSISMPKIQPGLMFPRSLIEGVDRFHMERRRLLPSCKNNLHILDGKENRYFIGIVDFLTRFDWRQKFAQHWKVVKYRCGDHSTKKPEVYARRFVNQIGDHLR